nr:SAM-dependent methyltransferase [Bifidobacterium dolichotidis]
MHINSATQQFIEKHRLEDVRQLALHAKRGTDVDVPFALNQIAGWQTARTKLPEWAQCAAIVYPPHISMEQCSSQFTAHCKMDIARRVLEIAGVQPLDAVNPSTTTDSPDARAYPTYGRMADLTGGFGVDCSYLARMFAHADYVERQSHLCDIARHNFAALGLPHIEVHNEQSEEYLQQVHESAKLDLLYLDPARRDDHGSRTYAIEDCTPNALELKDALLDAAHVVLMKLSPMLDWRRAVEQFGSEVMLVAMVGSRNECRELLIALSRDIADTFDPLIVTINDDQRLEYRMHNHSDAQLGDAILRNTQLDNSTSQSSNGEAVEAHITTDITRETPSLEIDCTDVTALETAIQQGNLYLFEPNACVMKAGAFDVLKQLFNVKQVGPQSHLFLSTSPQPQFPGRHFHVDRVGTMNKKSLKKQLQGHAKANIAVRNFPLTAQQLRRKLKLADGGDTYVFATTLGMTEHILFWCSKIQVE